MTETEAVAVREVLQETDGYEDLREGFPRFAEAIDALPDESKMLRVNVILREVFVDVVKRAKAKISASLIALLLCLLIGGCSQHIITLSDGSTYKANRFLDWTKIGSVSYDDGSFTLDGYESDTSRLIGIIDRLLVKYEEMLEARRLAVKP